VARKREPKQGRKNSPAQMTRHHLVPRSRCRVRGGTHTGNIRKIPRNVHEAWHDLFGAMTPFETLAYIVTVLAPPGYFVEAHFEVCWEGASYRFDLSAPKRNEPILAYRRGFNPSKWSLVFGGTVTWFSAAEQVANCWAPPNYFRHVQLSAAPEEMYFFSQGSDPT